MGKAYAIRGRIAPAAVVTALVAVAVIVAMGMLARPAAAQTTFTQCSTCHNYSYNDAYHNLNTHKLQTCATCHVNGSGAAGLVPSACATCHGPVATLIATTPHQGAGCGTTDGCHGYTSPTPSPSPSVTPAPVAAKVVAKVTPTTLKLGKKVTVKGTATPATSLNGKKAKLLFQIKKGAKWVKVKTASATVKAGAYKYLYKPGKKGTYHVTASVAATATSKAAKSKTVTFKVK